MALEEAKKMMNYKYIRSTLQTGDIVLFSGRGLFALLIKIFTISSLTHVGIVVRDGFTKQLSILESAVIGGKNGVQLNLLGARIKNHKGKLYIRKLVTERHPALQIKLQGFIRDNLGTSYEAGIRGGWELLCAALDFWPFQNKPNTSRYFCSELVTEIYKLWELIPMATISNEITPADFKFGDSIDKLLVYSQQPACLQKPIRVT